MTSIAALSFSGTNLLWPSVGFLIVAVVVLAWSYKAQTGWMRWVCLSLKVLGLCALALCLLEPLWFGERARPGANLFAIVADNSQGMQIKDQGDSETRGEQLQKLLDPAKATWLAGLGDNFDLRRYLFDSRLQTTTDFHELVFDGRASTIGGSLRSLAERFQGRSLAGIIILTDGNATDIRNQLPDLSKLPPIYPVVIGRPDAVKDISLQQVSVSQTAFEDSPVTIQADVSVAGFRGDAIQARLVDKAGKVVQEKSLDGRADGEVLPFRFELKPEEKGLSFYQVKVGLKSAPTDDSTAEKSGEATLANNSRVLNVNRDAGPYRILYVAGRLEWDFKFMNRALSEDKEIELASLIRIAKREPKFDFRGRTGESSNPLFRGSEGQGPETVQRYDEAVLIRLGTRDETELTTAGKASFPLIPEDLYDYHAIVVDRLEAEFFTVEQQQLVQKFVSERGGSFLMLAGMESLQEGNYARTPIGDMLPVYLDRPSEAAPAIGGMSLQLSKEGWLQPWARLRDNQTDEEKRRSLIPNFNVINRVRDLKPGATPIAVLKDSRNREIPGIAVQKFGRGRTAAMMVGDLYTWGLQDTETHADMDKLWRQLARYLVSDVPKRVQLTVEPLAEDAASSVVLQVRVRDAKYQPLNDAAVTIDVEPVVFEGTAPAAKGEAIHLRAEPASGEAGLYEATYVSRWTGGYKATAIASNSVGAEVGRSEAGWSVDLAAEEFRSLLPNAALMENIARKTGGEVIAARDLDAFVKKLPNLKAPIMETWSFPLWHTPMMFGFAMICLLGEWGLRRWKGMP